MTICHSILRMMADGRFYSGEELGRELGVSRAAVWKQLKKFSCWGLDVHSVRGKGYRISAPLELLDRDLIVRSIGNQSITLLSDIEIHFELDSTNRYLLALAKKGAASGYVCMAEYQFEGRGRRGRKWVSPLGRNIYLSLLWHFTDVVHSLGGLSLAVGVALARSLKQIGLHDVELKWPNDIYWQGRKLGGILIEIFGEASGPCCVVIGFGLNKQMDTTSGDEIDQPWVDLDTALGHSISRNHLAGILIGGMLQALCDFERLGLEHYLPEFQNFDAILGKPVVLRMGSQLVMGVARGVDKEGALLVDSNGHIQRYYSGDVSVREITN